MSIEEYEQLNERLAEELFSDKQAGRPVYVGVEDDALARALSSIKPADIGSLVYLRSAVRSTLNLDDSGVAPFRWYTDRLNRRVDVLDTPPTIALLVLLAIAADQMNAADGMAAHNYYGRLMQLLDVPEPRRQRVQSDYQRHAEDFWGSLNEWLEAWEGARGVPTAYAVGMRYVGLPMSQALVREHDRQQLTKIFRAEGLAPGFQMTPRDMDDVLSAWVTKTPSPLSGAFRTLYGNLAARERMLSVACLELEAWDGSSIGDGELDQSTVRSFGDLRLVASLQTFFATVLEINMSVPLVDGEAVPLEVEAGDGTISLAVARAAAGTGRLADVRQLDLGSLLVDEVIGRLGVEGRQVARRPRRVVPLRWHDLQSAYVEVERVERGERTLILAVGEVRSKLEQFLKLVARPGYDVHTEMNGLPDGWIAVTDVQIMAAASGTFHFDFLPLVPRAQTSLAFSGGMGLPGNLRKWSVMAPPEVQAVAAGASAIRVQIDRGTRLGDVVTTLDFEGESAIVDLRKLELTDGEYLVTLYVDGATKPASSAVLRLRSADTPVSAAAIDGTRLVYDPDSTPTWPVSAGDRVGDRCIDGVIVDQNAPVIEGSATMPNFSPRPRPARETSRVVKVRVGRQLGDRSCMKTGGHRFNLPDARGMSSVEGECETCGIVKRFPTTPWGARKRVAGRPRGIDVSQLASSLPPVSGPGDGQAAVLQDAVSHVGSGPRSAFDRIAGFAEATSLFSDTLMRDLEALGHVDIARDGMLNSVEWGVNWTALVPIGADEWFLSGRTSPQMVHDLRFAMEASNGTLVEDVDRHLLTVHLRGSVDGEHMDEACEEHGITRLDENPAMSIAKALPPVSALAAGLTRIPIPAARMIEKWDTASASWIDAASMHEVGAYRLSNFSRTYCLRSEADIEAGSIGIATVQIVKHVANAWARDPLAGYHEPTSSILVPRGADLPGLYARAAVVSSGRGPDSTSAALQYRDVPRDVADALHAKLSA
jgi:hypothetical protein